MSNGNEKLLNTALVYFNDNNRIGGFYTTEAGERLALTGGWEAGATTVEFSIVDADSGELRGQCVYRKRLNPKTALSPIADGMLQIDGDTTPICVRPANVTNPKTGAPEKAHTVFKDSMAQIARPPF